MFLKVVGWEHVKFRLSVLVKKGKLELVFSYLWEGFSRNTCVTFGIFQPPSDVSIYRVDSPNSVGTGLQTADSFLESNVLLPP